MFNCKEFIKMFYLLCLFLLLSVQKSTSNPLALCHTNCRIMLEHCNFTIVDVKDFRRCHTEKKECNTKCTFQKSGTHKCKNMIRRCFKKKINLQRINDCVKLTRTRCRSLYPQEIKAKPVTIQ